MSGEPFSKKKKKKENSFTSSKKQKETNKTVFEKVPRPNVESVAETCKLQQK